MAEKYKITTISIREIYSNLYRALGSNTTYAVGTFGSSLNIEKNLKRITKSGWNAEHKEQIYADAEKGDCFAFDCIGLVKSCGWWGFRADPKAIYGGSVYERGMPDISVRSFFRDTCYKAVRLDTVDFAPFGAFLGLDDNSHIAFSLGNNILIEATRYGEHRVRYARIRGKSLGSPVDRELPERAFDYFAFSKYVDLSDLLIGFNDNGQSNIVYRNSFPNISLPATIMNLSDYIGVQFGDGQHYQKQK